VIRACQSKPLSDVAREISRVSTQVREGGWKGDSEVKGTVTITNFGMGKVPIGIPMIIPGQAAILGVGAIQKKILIDDEDRMSIGQTLFFSLTFDHRLVDGMYASKFFQAVRRHLNEFKFYN
jgi:2-oxoglutarate dehydrogenase E2 component (dihydrolipoamide succinyltransferase)